MEKDGWWLQQKQTSHNPIQNKEENTMKQVILTGDRPTGRLHVGHYASSLQLRANLQDSGQFDEIYIMVADAQALTDNAEHPEKVRSSVIEVTLDNLACGLDPDRSTLFVQSMVPQLTELTFYYMNLVTVSRLRRNPTVKAEIQMRNFEASIPVGFFCYPISQAADITAFRATTVPVGEDQSPMVEQCREIVHKFNTVYGETLTMPEAVLPENTACRRLPGIDGKAKMSKSLNNCIYLSDTPECLDELKDHYRRGGLGDVQVKRFLEQVLQARLSPIRQRRKYWEDRLPEVYDILRLGSEKARVTAAATLNDVREAMKLNYFG